MVSWSSIKSLLLFLGPLLLPRLISWSRNLQRRIRTRRVLPRQPLPPATGVALGVLFAVAVIALASTLPLFSPENIFLRTSSRLMTSGGVLTTRLAALRPLTPADARLREVFDAGGLDARLLYAAYGPAVVADCPLARPGELGADSVLFWYALPGLLAPHAAHLVALGVATSATWCGRDGAEWRTWATAAALVLAAAELWLVATYDVRANARSVRVADIDFVYWKLRVWRGLGMAMVDGLLGWAIWLQATGRAFWIGGAATSPAQRVVEQGRAMEEVLMRLKGVGVVANTLLRDPAARARTERYWAHESEVMKDVTEHPDVLAAQRSALTRLDMTRVERESDAFAELVANQIRAATGQPQATQ